MIMMIVVVLLSFCLKSVCLIVSCPFGSHMNAWIFIIFILMDDYYQFIFGKVIGNLVTGPTFCARDIKLAVYFSLTMNVLIISFVFFCFAIMYNIQYQQLKS